MAFIKRSTVKPSIDGVHFASQISMPSSKLTTISGSHCSIEQSSMPSFRNLIKTPLRRSAQVEMAVR